MKNKNIRVRLAPSPTGLFHLGGLRTALTNFLFAKKEGGTFIVRVEDTDQTRLVPEAIPDMLESLRWAGITIDEGVIEVKSEKLKVKSENTNSKEEYEKVKENIVQKGDFGPYVQSERVDIYRKYAKELMKKGLAYPCFCTPERLEKLREKSLAKGIAAPRYDRHCLDCPKDEMEKRMKTEPYVIRLKTPQTGTTSFVDKIRGKIEIENKNVDDQVLIKTDGFPTYHFASVIDDYLMKISHVVRGEEWIPSTPKHVLIYQAFGWQAPEFIHIPVILNMQGGKLSKRDGSVSVSDFREKGYVPEAIVNFVALLGWNPKTTQEIFSMEELIDQFSLDKLNSSSPKFDYQRLEWFGAYYIKQKSIPELAKLCKPFLKDYTSDMELIKKIVYIQKNRMHCLSEVAVGIDFVFSLADYSIDLLYWKNMGSTQLKESLSRALEVITKIKEKDFTLESLQNILMEAAGKDRGSFLWPLRVALTGLQQSPSPFECAWILGKEQSIKRIEKAIKRLR